MAGWKPNTDNPVFVELLALAQEFYVPRLIHMDSSVPDYLSPLC
ncbi:MAG: hypothetical protein ACFFDF_01260 [Candidatus Odinarchaeota archaeon]